MITVANIIIKRLGHKIDNLWFKSDNFNQIIKCKECNAKFGLTEFTDYASLTFLWRTDVGVFPIKICELCYEKDILNNLFQTIDKWFICERLKVLL
jgi:hypothetical protein